nr:terminase large subunit [uncultured Mediterranean phage uvMED]BAR26601.1 terminase large subunit [uncultured Mediterranean phage uvMED]BAR26604.1 terminase large subunit [uncultured Mediterranean phage uvMED]BAR26734.1 terminase large subunit [uncultured Mediterranean phage uvMED]BAR26793.1 terminase large subunit [uncultured Mediterranean phage uvMED]
MNPFVKGFLEGIVPPEPITVSAWSDANRVLSSRASSESGAWRTSRVPYLKEPMDLLSVEETDVERVVLMFAAQVGKTELGINALMYWIDVAPSSILCVAPSLDMVKRMTVQRLEPAFDETPCIKDKLPKKRAKDKSNSMFMKEFPNGLLMLTGSNSSVGLRSAPIRYLFMDEVSSFQESVSSTSGIEEGDPCSLAEKRTTNYANRKILLTSTPTEKDHCRIEQEFKMSDQRYFQIKSPCCGGYQDLKFGQLRWKPKQPETVEYECALCGERFTEAYKTSMLRQGKWQATKPLIRKTAGFHLSGLYSPSGWLSWSTIVEEWETAQEAPALLRSFINTRLSETFDESYQSTITVDSLIDKLDDYLPSEIPEDVLCLVAGVDVQGGGGTKDERLECSVFGISKSVVEGKEELWLIDHFVLHGDPTQSEVWQGLDIILDSEYDHPKGGKLKIQAMAVDSGGLATHSVYNYCRLRKRKGVIAIKGSSLQNQPVINTGSNVNISIRGMKTAQSVKIYSVGGDTIKDELFPRIKMGKGIHFHKETTEEYFKELTGEYKDSKLNNARRRVYRYVQKRNQSVEKLDCCVYAYAAWHFILKQIPISKIFPYLEKKLENNAKKPEKKRNLKKNSTITTKSYDVFNWN